MRPYTELTPTGQIRRLRSLATAVATSEYGIANPSLRVMASSPSFNTIFRVDAADRRLVLRVGTARRIHVRGVEDVEAAWLRSLAAGSAIVAPRPVAATDGRWWVERAHDGVPGARACAMFTFVEGRPLWPRATATAMVAAGRLLALLHEHAANASLAVEIPDALRADRVVYLPHDNRLVRYRSAHGSLIVEAMDRVQQRLAALWTSPPHRPHLLHGDFTPRNILTWRSQLRPVDFQDLQLGFDLQDVALTLADLDRTAPALIDPFTAGYRQVRAWPALDRDSRATLAAARSLNLMNLGLHLRGPRSADFVADHARRVVRWMRDPTSRAASTIVDQS